MTRLSATIGKPHLEGGPGSPIRFSVYRDPAPGRTRQAARLRGETASRIVMVDLTNPPKSWREEVAQIAGVHMQDRTPLSGPVELSLTFHLRRPRCHARKPHARMRDLHASAPAFPKTRPKLLKLARAIENVLTGVVYGNSAQIVNAMIRKRYGNPERIEIGVRELVAPAPLLEGTCV